MVPLIITQTEMSNPSIATYSGEPELLALMLVIKQLTVVHNLAGEVKFGEAFDNVMPAVHRRYSPDKQGTANQAASPGHYDALIDELYPKVGLSELGGINGTQLKPLTWTTVFQK